jgi:hypothetical protein
MRLCAARCAGDGPRTGAVYVAESFSVRDPGLRYQVTLLADGTWTCSCPGFAYRQRKDGGCRNIDEAREKYEYSRSLAFLLSLTGA